MAILRAELPVEKDNIPLEGLVADKACSRFTLIHGPQDTKMADSNRQDIGFTSRLVTRGSNSARLTIEPYDNITPINQESKRELIIRSVARAGLAVTLRRFHLPDDPDFEPITFPISSMATLEIAYGLVPVKGIKAVRFNPLTRTPELEEQGSIMYLRTVVWRPDEHFDTRRARLLSDEWSE